MIHASPTAFVRLLLAALIVALAAVGISTVRRATAAPIAVTDASLNAYDAGFSYQGTLTDGGVPASGIYDFRFELLAEGGIVGVEYVAEDVEVTDGLFATTVGITGSGMWNGQRRFLRVSARADGETEYIAIGEPTEILPAPYAFHARQASSAVEANVAATLANVGPTVVQVGTFDMMQSDGFGSLTFAAKGDGRLEVARPGGAGTEFVYIPVDVPAQVIGFGQKLATLSFCYSGTVDNGLGVLAGIQEANVRQMDQFAATSLVGESYTPQLAAIDECVNITTGTPQLVSGSLWVRFKITASPVPLEFGEVKLTFVSE